MTMTKGACELKSAQFSLMRLAIYQTDANAIQNFVADQVSAAPELLEGAPVALDFGTSGRAADAEFVEDIVARLRYAGMQPIALVAEPDSAHAAIAKGLRLGVLAPLKRFGKGKPEIVESSDAQRKNAPTLKATTAVAALIPVAKALPVELPVELPIAAPPTSPVQSRLETIVQPTQVLPSQHAQHQQVLPRQHAQHQQVALPNVRVESARVEPAAPVVLSVQRYEGQVRSGQQLYAKGRDLIVTGTAGASSEVIADGSIHIYGRLMGKVIAGASGDRSARIYCLAFAAELVSIAGIFRIFEAIPADLRGKSVQICLDGDKLHFDILN